MSAGRAPRAGREEQDLREARRARREARDRRERAAREIEEREREREQAPPPRAARDRERDARRSRQARPERDARRPRQARPERRTGKPPRRRSAGSELAQRILIGVPLAVVAIVFVDVGGIAFAALMAVVSVLCLIELNRMLARWRPAVWISYAAAVALVAAAHFGSDRTVLELAMATVPATFLAVAVRSPPARENMPTVSIAGTLLGIVWIALGFAHAELLRSLPHGNAIVIDVMLGTFLADVGAYLGGRMFGRRPLAPAISPNKTVEGLCLGMFTAVLAVFVAGRFQQTWLTEGQSLLLGLTIAVLGPIGDLFESVVKRDAGVKDAGSLFGAHGGALDRLDAILFTVVGGYYVWVGLLH